MKANTYKDKSTESLSKLEKTTVAVIGLFAGILTVLFVVTILLTFKQGFTTFLIVPFSLLPLLGLNMASLKKIRQELRARETVF
ncbi:hypothetical protein GGR92_004004 [Spirosoma lacussanchae]|uniref:redox-active disulfide protein 2 n=1 Tax=Spirosoma lacussanchae TaxID=1884249 RepID=UPI0011086B54|nr:redox-active disulfide protein 2 [Spirosoma lacussanchae]